MLRKPTGLRIPTTPEQLAQAVLQAPKKPLARKSSRATATRERREAL